MQIVLKRLFLFLLPFALFFSFPVFILFVSRESYSIEQAVQTQKKYPEAIVGFAYSNISGYQQMLVNEKNPAVFALGNSHTGQFRKAFFIQSSNFITAGNGVGTIDGMNTFIENLPKNNTTKVLIIGLDQFMFSSPSLVEGAPDTGYERTRDLLSGRWKTFYLDFFAKKFSINSLFSQSQKTKNIGLIGVTRGQGFREDGSYQYVWMLTKPNREETLKNAIDTSILLIKENRSSSPSNAPFSSKSIASLNKLLILCQKKNIYVIGFLSPYPLSIYQEDMSINDLYKKRILEFPKVVNGIFSNYGFALYDFTNSSILGNRDTEFVDQGHGTDKLYLRMVIYMAERNKQLAKYVDIAKDKELLKNTKRDFIEDDIPN
ncbi:MAG: hypothetical protein NT098_02055 [Candidatus Parcubacteria bacterium]|nr:hypothetical protein [Candidatus Parcubacteria bacterium]